MSNPEYVQRWRERPPLTRLRNITTEIAEGAYRGPEGARWPLDPNPHADAARRPYDGMRPIRTINQLVDELGAVHHDLEAEAKVAHAAPEGDIAWYQAELESCRAEIERMRAIFVRATPTCPSCGTGNSVKFDGLEYSSGEALPYYRCTNMRHGNYLDARQKDRSVAFTLDPPFTGSRP